LRRVNVSRGSSQRHIEHPDHRGRSPPDVFITTISRQTGHASEECPPNHPKAKIFTSPQHQPLGGGTPGATALLWEDPAAAAAA
jgi:hypothetical protein